MARVVRCLLGLIGGCDANMIGHNHGLRISSIIAASPIITGILNPKSKFVDDIVIKRKFIREGGFERDVFEMFSVNLALRRF